MKKLFLPLLILNILLLSSCSIDDETQTDPTIINKQLTGSSANDLLSSDNYTSMTVELVYVEGYQPTTTAINSLRQFLEERTYKPDGITINTRSIPSINDSELSIDEVVELEENNRSLYTEGDEIAVYVLYTNSSNENDSNNFVTLGAAYWNTSIVIYGATIENLSNQSNSPGRAVIEATTFRHEFGHLFGLVDIGTETQSPHADPNSPGHCEVDNCLMQASVAFGSGLLNLLDDSDGVPDLGSECIADLQANGGR